MGTIALQVPTVGQLNATEAPKIASDFTTLQTVINGNLDSANIAASLATSAGVNATATVKGAVNNAGPGTRTNVAYGALNDAPDQVTGIVLPTNGLIAVWFQATWQESVIGAARAAVFIAANQLKIGSQSSAVPVVQEAQISALDPVAGTNSILSSVPAGLNSQPQSAGGTSYSGDVLTGQALGYGASAPCYIFAAAGTYTVSVQYKASSGTVTASNRKLWVQALSFA